MSKLMTRDDVLRIVSEAHKAGEGPNLCEANLTNADLKKVDLNDANLHRANLYGANLFGATLIRANLSAADLSNTNLNAADLYGANLYGANLSGAGLYGAILQRAKWNGLCVDGLHPFRCLLIPLPTGWRVEIGCWSGTLFELRELIAQDDGWPRAKGEEITRHRPLLEAFADMCDVHITGRPSVIAELAERWGDSDE